MDILNVSIPTYNEIAGLLEQAGKRYNPGEPLQIGKTSALKPPIDYRLATIRRDCVIEASKIFAANQMYDQAMLVEMAEYFFQYVLHGKENG